MRRGETIDLLDRLQHESQGMVDGLYTFLYEYGPAVSPVTLDLSKDLLPTARIIAQLVAQGIPKEAILEQLRDMGKDP